MFRSELSKVVCLCDLVEKTLTEFEKIENKKTHKNEKNPEYSKLAWEYTNMGTSRTLHQHCILSSTVTSMSRKKYMTSI